MFARILWVAATALALRLSIILWAMSAVHVMPQSTLSRRYFEEGYAIAAGWGYVATIDEAQRHLTLAQQRVESGGFYAWSAGAGPRPTSSYAETLHPPGMSLVVATLQRLFGGDGNLAIMILGALLDTAAAIVLYLTIRAAWSEPVAFATALTYALFLPQAYAATASRLADGFESFFLITGFACILHGLRPREARAYVLLAGAGLLFGIGAYFRPDYVLIGAGVFPFIWLYLRSMWRATAASAAILAFTFIALAPWAYRNDRIFGRWIFTSTSVGGTLITGLGEFSNPWGFGGSDRDREREAKAQGFASAWTPQADSYFKKTFARAVEARPQAFLITVVKRVPLVLAPAFGFGFDNPRKTSTFSDQRAAGRDRYQAMLHNPLYALAAYWDALIFAVVSFTFLLCSLYMFWAEPMRRHLVALLMSPHLYAICVHIFTHLEPRFLLPSLFSLMIGFGYWTQTSVESAPAAPAAYR